MRYMPCSGAGPRTADSRVGGEAPATEPQGHRRGKEEGPGGAAVAGALQKWRAPPGVPARAAAHRCFDAGSTMQMATLTARPNMSS